MSSDVSSAIFFENYPAKPIDESKSNVLTLFYMVYNTLLVTYLRCICVIILLTMLRSLLKLKAFTDTP